MNLASLIFLAFAMSTDAFAAAVGKGASLHKPRWSEALRTGVIFGVIEAITPLLGWLLGVAAAQYLSHWDHWIAFGLLFVLGARMVYGSFQADEETAVKPQRHSFWLLALTAVATSIDALAVGVGLALIEVNILLAALLIGLATTIMVTLGVMLGRVLGTLVGKRAETLGGVVLMVIGTVILVQGL